MIKRDTIQRVVLTPPVDTMDGATASIQPYETLTVAVSIGATNAQVAEFGPKESVVLNVVSDVKLDEFKHARYIFSGKRYKLMRQVKRGNEYFSVLMETNE